MIVDPFPCARQCIEQSCVFQCLELTPRQHPLPDQFRVVVGAAELISEIHRVRDLAGGGGGTYRRKSIRASVTCGPCAICTVRRGVASCVKVLVHKGVHHMLVS